MEMNEKNEKSVTGFVDFNFKLAVIQQLMYDMELLTPKFDLNEFIENHSARKINRYDHEYELIPEVKAYFESFPIPKDLLNKVEELYQDGGNEIYDNIIGVWDGEDEIFNITSTDDLVLVPNLTKITLFYDENEEMVDKFSEKGIEAEYV